MKKILALLLLIITLVHPVSVLADDSTLTLNPSTPLASGKVFLMNYTGVSDNCVIIRIQKLRDDNQEEYMQPSDAHSTNKCEGNSKNYLSFRVDGRHGVGDFSVDGLSPGSYVVYLLQKAIKGKFFDGDVNQLNSLSITIPGDTIESGSCEQRSATCDDKSFPICVKNTGSCTAPPNCAMAAENETVDCAYPIGATIPFPEDRVLTTCPVCTPGTDYDPSTQTCSNGGSLTSQTCTGINSCTVGVGCADTSSDKPSPVPSPPCAEYNDKGECQTVSSALGPLKIDLTDFTKTIFTLLLSVSGGIILLVVIRSGYLLLSSQGNAEKVKEAQDRLTSAFIGLLFLIFSLVILQVIGVDILHIPGFGS